MNNAQLARADREQSHLPIACTICQSNNMAPVDSVDVFRLANNGGTKLIRWLLSGSQCSGRRVWMSWMNLISGQQCKAGNLGGQTGISA